MNSRKKALITGIAGQDGSYLAELLFNKGYDVYGFDKSFSQLTLKSRSCIKELIKVDLTKTNSLRNAVLKIEPDEIYHLAAYHFSSQKNGNLNMSFEPFNTINLLATNKILEVLRDDLLKCRFFYASSSHIFGKPDVCPQNEKTSYRPESLYSITKAAGNELCKFYREHYNIYASVGILYNHESPRRSLSFISAQIAETAAKAFLGLPVKLKVRDLDSLVDWGAAKDYVNAMWLTLQQPYSDDYIIASGSLKQLRDFARIAFKHVALNADDFVFQDQQGNKTDSIPLLGDPTKIRNKCNWIANISFNDLVTDMVDSHIKRLKRTVNR